MPGHPVARQISLLPGADAARGVVQVSRHAAVPPVARLGIWPRRRYNLSVSKQRSVGTSMGGFRTGLGYDLHRLVPGTRLLLGGVSIPFDRELRGHSDADVVLHALCDALLGAAGLGDIGELFPDDDPRYRGIASALLLRQVVQRVHQVGLRVVNVDVIIHAEWPRLAPHREAIRHSLAGLLGVDPQCVGVKAKTNEGLGEVGRGEAIACWATALLEQVDRRAPDG